MLAMNIENKQKIIFFFPYYQVSGVPVLFIRFAKALSKKGRKILIVDFKDGYMHKKLKREKNIKFMFYKKGEKFTFPDNSTIIFQSIIPETLPKNLKFNQKNKIIFWTLYQANFIQTVIPIDFFKNFQYRYPKFFKNISKLLFPNQNKRLSQMINDMHKKNSIFFMSYDTYDFTNKFLKLDFVNPKLIPVCIDSSPKSLNKNKIQNKSINITWVGRLDDFKIHILNYFIECLNQSKFLNSHKIIFHVIGDGAFSINYPKYLSNNLKIKHTKNVDHDRLDNILLDTHLFVGMGTSALEASRYGIPTLCVDFFYKKINFNYQFSWMFEKNQYDLGSMINKNTYRNFLFNNLDKKLSELINNFNQISLKSYNHFEEHHSLDKFISVFENEVNISSFKYSDFNKKVFDDTFLRKIYNNFKTFFAKDVW